MSAVTVRNLPDETHRALKARAEKHGRSTEAEIREILKSAVRPKEKLGTLLAAYVRDHGVEELVIARDQAPIRAAIFE